MEDKLSIRSRINEYIRTWEGRCYVDGIPDEAPREIDDRVPSYRKIALAILRNDTPLKSLGFTPPQSVYYGILKRKELKERAAKMFIPVLQEPYEGQSQTVRDVSEANMEGKIPNESCLSEPGTQCQEAP